MTNLELNDDQRALRAAMRDLFAAESPVERVRKAEPLGFDADLWDVLVATGLPLIGLPEAEGGAGAGSLDLAIVAQEYGRALAPAPLIEAITAANLLARAGAPSELLAEIGSGAVLPTLALRPVPGARAELVPAGAVADLLVAWTGDRLVASRREPGRRPHVVPPQNLAGLPLADWSLGAGETTELAVGAEAARLYADALDEWRLLTAAALDGLRERALAIGVDYVKQRHAFGVPLGWFQAIQHRFADNATAGDGARLLVYEAAWSRQETRPEAARLASMALLFAADVAFQTCRSSLQFHGGYGYTLEYDIQLFFRRAKAWPVVLGPRQDEYRHLAELAFVTEQEA